MEKICALENLNDFCDALHWKIVEENNRMNVYAPANINNELERWGIHRYYALLVM